METVTVGGLVRRFREQARLTQYELADVSTVSVRTIRNLENGLVERPRQDTIRLIADSLSLSHAQRLALQTACGGNIQDTAVELIGDAAPIPPPTRMNAVVGRQTEVAALVDAITRDLNRWITIAGLNGVGKTAVALEVAHSLHELYSYSVLWVACDESSDPRYSVDKFLVESAVVTEVCRIGDHIAGTDFNARQLCRMIGHRRTLLVLDGWDLSPVGASRIMALLAGCHGLRVILTTRNHHYTPEDHLFPLEPLDAPVDETEVSLSKVERYPAVQLMLSHIRRLRPKALNPPAATTDIAIVSSALDGIPAALKMGAEWALMQSPGQLVERAREDPLSLLVPPTAAVDRSDFVKSLQDVLLDINTQDLELLRTLSGVTGMWTLMDVAEFAGIGFPAAAKKVSELLVRGLIRQCGDSAGPEFRVLRLVSCLLERIFGC
jgi:transcriptional regulator with XRE-family HTH domain